MFRRLNRLPIGRRLTRSFLQIILMFGALSAVVILAILYISNDYNKILDNYAYPQGTIALAMNESAEMRAATRGIIGYDSDELIQSTKKQHEQAVADFKNYLEQIRPTMITPEGLACMDAIDQAWAEYQSIDAKVIEIGATTDIAKSLDAQTMMLEEAAPKYQALDSALENLMNVNVSCGAAERTALHRMQNLIIFAILAVIVLAVLYAGLLSTAITKSIAKPLSELKARFLTFAEGDLDSPLPVVHSKDEIAELIHSISLMADRINTIIKDTDRLLNEMAKGNFNISTECEKEYMGAFHSLLLGMRKMNRHIDTTLHGVNASSEQVLMGSTNLAEAAQSVAEGATKQAIAVEKMQASFDELSNGIKQTANELEESYNEAYRYANVAESSRVDMEAMMNAMNRISETSEKIGEIVKQIEDIASQTNLLSVNASIEAARAGQAGKGFAVVADQIRSLAAQSAQSAVDSKALIDTAIYEVEEGNKNAVKASDSLKEVVNGVKAIADNARKMKELSLEQAENMAQTDKEMVRIEEVVQGNSAAAEETSATSEELMAQASALSDLVSVFTLREE